MLLICYIFVLHIRSYSYNASEIDSYTQVVTRKAHNLSTKRSVSVGIVYVSVHYKHSVINEQEYNIRINTEPHNLAIKHI